MKRVLVIDAGLKPGWTKKTADLMIENLSKVNNYEFERINLRDEQIAPAYSGLSGQLIRRHPDTIPETYGQ